MSDHDTEVERLDRPGNRANLDTPVERDVTEDRRWEVVLRGKPAEVDDAYRRMTEAVHETRVGYSFLAGCALADVHRLAEVIASVRRRDPLGLSIAQAEAIAAEYTSRRGRRTLTLTEAAALLGVTAATLRQQIANGKLRATKRGRDWFVTPKEVERYRKESLQA